MFSMLATQTFLNSLYTAQVIWHSAAFAYFGLWPEHTMLIGTTRLKSKNSAIHSKPGGDDWHHDLFRYLGYINSAFALLRRSSAVQNSLRRNLRGGSRIGCSGADCVGLGEWLASIPRSEDTRAGGGRSMGSISLRYWIHCLQRLTSRVS
jgi:hypothetical protein